MYKVNTNLKLFNMMEILVNFGGFYDSIHNDVIDSRIEMDYDYMGDDVDIVDHYDNVEWTPTFNNYGEAYVDRLNNKFNFDLKFKSIWSPREYNFTSDQLVIDINNSDIDFIYNDIYNEEFVEYVNDVLKSRDGFHSYYDDGITSPFINILERSECGNERAFENLIELYIEWMIINNDINDDVYDLEFEIKYFK